MFKQHLNLNKQHALVEQKSISDIIIFQRFIFVRKVFILNHVFKINTYTKSNSGFNFLVKMYYDTYNVNYYTNVQYQFITVSHKTSKNLKNKHIY